MNNLMILSEDEEYQSFHYRVSCQCTDPNCCIDLDIVADTVRSDGKDQICGWSIEFWQTFQGWRSYWKRLKTGLSLIFGSKHRWMTNCFVLDEDNVKALEYVLKKYWELNKSYNWNAYHKFLDNHIQFIRLFNLARTNNFSSKDKEHLNTCDLCNNILHILQQEAMSK